MRDMHCENRIIREVETQRFECSPFAITRNNHRYTWSSTFPVLSVAGTTLCTIQSPNTIIVSRVLQEVSAEVKLMVWHFRVVELLRHSWGYDFQLRKEVLSSYFRARVSCFYKRHPTVAIVLNRIKIQ